MMNTSKSRRSWIKVNAEVYLVRRRQLPVLKQHHPSVASTIKVYSACHYIRTFLMRLNHHRHRSARPYITTPPGSPLPVTCARATPPATSTPTPVVKTSRDCVPLCGARCRVETNKKTCRRMCMKCCDRCKCFPPGHCGTNMDKCGKCYIDMEDHGHKCP
ncbi:hypothetical protein ACLB2K_061648 [Fragaria x ananassa]